MDLQNIITDRAAAKADFMGETLHFKYRPALITADTFQKLENMGDVEELAVFFTELVVSWDLTRGEKEVAITAENIRTLPMQLLRAMITTITNDVPQREGGKV